MPNRFKIPQSVLVVIHTPEAWVLLLRRVVSNTPVSGFGSDQSGEFWQSVTGSKDHPDEDWADTAAREVWEETGLDCAAPGHCLTDWGLENCYSIYPQWRHRYAPQVVQNTERVFGLLVQERLPIQLSPREHDASVWLPYQAAADRCFSASNAEACLLLPRFLR